MSEAGSQLSREDVLNAFSVEPSPGRETLERYLRTYPQFASELVDLSRELNRGSSQNEAPLSADEQAMIDSAWQHYAGNTFQATADPFVGLSTADLRMVAKRLDVPRQVISAFRERRIIVSTVPRRFLARLAEAISTSIDRLIAALSSPSSLALSRSYKADHKPDPTAPVSFERILIDAGVPDDRRAHLMSEAD